MGLENSKIIIITILENLPHNKNNKNKNGRGRLIYVLEVVVEQTSSWWGF